MKKLKKWQFVLLIIFYPIGFIYFCVWLYNKNKSKKVSSLNNSVQLKMVTKVQSEDVIEIGNGIEELLANVEKAQNQIDRHFAYMLLQDYYYEKRKESDENMQACIDWCIRDISELDKLDEDFYKQLQEEKKTHIAILGKKGFKKWHESDYWDRDKFDCHILAFKKLAIIYEQAKDYANAISIAEQAETYYKSHNNKWLPDAQKRLERLRQKAAKE